MAAKMETIKDESLRRPAFIPLGKNINIRELSHVFKVDYENDILRVQCTEAKHNLVRILRYLEDQEISFGRVYSELPTLNDVFLEITGKELRD